MKIKTNTTIRMKVIAFVVAVTTLASSTTVTAGFLDDFYTSAGAAVNITPAEAFQTATMNGLTGGGIVWKTPQRNFTPFYVTPPSLKAGCGGIDFFLGAFGMANKEQFVQFLRNVGQNASGLAFKVALQAMAPDLESKIQEVANYINDWNKYFGNSCAAAQKLMDSGPSQWIRDTVQSAKSAMLSNGSASDASAAEDAVKSNGAAAISNAPTYTISIGQVVMAPELNIVWSALGSADMNLSKAEKEMMMSLIGTNIMRKVGTGEDQVISPDPKDPLLTVQQLVGNTDDPVSELKVWECGDADKCMNVNPVMRYEKSFSKIIFEKAKNIQDAIINRYSPQPADLKLLTVTTSVPIYKIIALSTMPNRPSYSNQLIENYSNLIGWEIATRYIDDAGNNLQKFLRIAKETELNATKAEALTELQKRIDSIRIDMQSKRDDIYQQINRVGQTMTMLELMERNLYGSLSAQMAANLNFGR